MSLTRLKPFSMHFFISLIMLLGVMFFVRQFWFPGPHFVINGGIKGLFIVAPTFLVPTLLTLIIYNTKKTRRHVRCDMTVIVLLQVIALGFGLSKIYSNRITVEVLTPSGIIAAPTIPDIKGFSPTANVYHDIKKLNAKNLHPVPAYIYAANSGDINAIYDEFRLEKYQSFFDSAFKYSIIDTAKKARKELSNTESNELAITSFAKSHPGKYYYFPVYGKYGKAVKVIDEHFMPVTYLNTIQNANINIE